MAGSLGFIGGGQMASALALGFVKSQNLKHDSIIISDKDSSRLAALSEMGFKATDNNRDVLLAANTIVLAVKPHIVPAVLSEIRQHVKAHHLIISIAAGVTLQTLEAGLSPQTRVARVMPNTPSLVQEGASVFCLGGNATKSDAKTVELLCGAVGYAVSLPESKLDAVTGLSGSGPAYVFMFIEALADGGVRMGLPRDVAQRLAAQTVLGAAKMVRDSGKHPGALKDAVASPGGTTIAGIHALEKAGLRAAAMNAVEAAARRSQELAAPPRAKL